MSLLRKCPTCGSSPEFHWKNYTFGACSGSLKCPYGHLRVQQGYWAGGQAKAQRVLIEKWDDAVQQLREGADK